MVKSNYTPLNKLNDQSKNIKVKVKVIQKNEPKQSPHKKRYQKLLLQDDEGNTMDGTIFGDDIEIFEQALERNKEYELGNLIVKPVPEAHRARAVGDYQINFNTNVHIAPLDLSGSSSGPQYRSLDKIPRTQSAIDELIDVVGVMLYVSDIRPVRHEEAEHKVRDIILADQSITRPIKLSAWNRLAELDAPLYKAWPEGFLIVGFCDVLPLTYRGLSLKTSQTTEFEQNPSGEVANAVQSWVEVKKSILEEWREKAIRLYSTSGNKVPVPLSEMGNKKANSIWPDEKFWIQGTMSALEADEIRFYTGCSKCGKGNKAQIGSKIVCDGCHTGDAIAVQRALMNVFLYDNTGSLKITAYTKELELIVGLKVEELATLQQTEKSGAFTVRIDNLKKKEMLLQITPASTLFQNNMLRWIVKDVEVPPEAE